MATEIDSVIAFIERATGIYKYTKPTGSNLKNAVNVISQVLQEEELNSIKLVEDRADDIISRLDNKSPGRYTPASLLTYKSRALRALNDYQRYGKEISKLNSMPTQSTRRPKATDADNKKRGSKAEIIDKNLDVKTQIIDAPFSLGNENLNLDTKMQTLDLSLKNGRGVVIYYPTDLSVMEAEKISKVLGGIAALSEE